MSETPQIETVFDDSEQHIGRVYAQALMSAGAKQNKSDQIVDELYVIVDDVFSSSPKLETLLVNPRVDAMEKVGVIDRVFGSKIDGTLLKFLKVCAIRRRLGSLRSIAKAAREMQDAVAGRLQVQVTTAQKLDDKQVEQLQAKLKQALSADVRMTTKIDPEILGGLIVRVGDTLYDASVDGRLKQMKRTAQQQAEATIRQKIRELAS